MTVQAPPVLDSSALLAYLRNEPGREVVAEMLVQGAVMSATNYAEVLSHLSDGGQDPARAEQRLRREGLIGSLLGILPFTPADALVTAQLRSVTRPAGLSLGDRACLATALRLGAPAVTADRAWASIQLGIPIRQIHP